MPDIKTDDGCIIHVEVEGPQNGPVLMLSNSLGTNLHLLKSPATWRYSPQSGVPPLIGAPEVDVLSRLL
jgi:hypothetical protein